MDRFSRLAILAQLSWLAYVGLAVVTIQRVWQFSTAQALLCLLVFAMLPAAVIASGVFLAYITGYQQRASFVAYDLFRTWWTELWAAARAGFWWQPIRWRQFPNSVSVAGAGNVDVCIASASAANHNAVVILLHGFASNRGLWNPWMRLLNQQEVAFICLNLEPLFGSIDRYVKLIEQAVCEAEKISNVKPLVICHSMGGLALRKWLVSHPDARQRVGKIVTIGTPHLGTWLGGLLWSTNGREMRLGSRWLAELQAQEKQLRPDHTYAGFICWYSNLDNIVIPASSGRLPGADNRRIASAGHIGLVYHPRVMQLEQYLH